MVLLFAHCYDNVELMFAHYFCKASAKVLQFFLLAKHYRKKKQHRPMKAAFSNKKKQHRPMKPAFSNRKTGFHQ